MLDRDLAKWNTEVRGLVGACDAASVARLADLQDRIRAGEQRATELREQTIGLSQGLIDEATAARTLALFDPVWECLTPIEQGRVLSLLVDRIDYDGANGQVSITFHPAGIQSLADRLAHQKEKRA